jgi:hypothetical protein
VQEVVGPDVIELTRKHNWRCKICGRVGKPNADWAKDCMAGHPFWCACGRKFATPMQRGAHVATQRCYTQPEGEK